MAVVDIAMLQHKLRRRDYVEDLSLDGRIIWQCIFKKWDMGRALDWSGSGQGQVTGSFKHGDEPLGFIKCGEALD
jgi:hypothetical protein